MQKHAEDHRFLVDQINEIKRYIIEHSNEDPDKVVLYWVSHFAVEYRIFWKMKHKKGE